MQHLSLRSKIVFKHKAGIQYFFRQKHPNGSRSTKIASTDLDHIPRTGE
jgi:hypothetical protein